MQSLLILIENLWIILFLINENSSFLRFAECFSILFLIFIFIFDWIFIYTSGWTGETGYVSAKTICAMMPKPSEDSLVLVRFNSILYDLILFHVNLAFYFVILDSNSLLLNFLICTSVYVDFTAETNIIWINYLCVPDLF